MIKYQQQLVIQEHNRGILERSVWMCLFAPGFGVFQRIKKSLGGVPEKAAFYFCLFAGIVNAAI